MLTCRDNVRKEYLTAMENVENDKILVDIAASYERSWLTQSHKFNYGLDFTIDLKTGYFADFAVISKFFCPYTKETNHLREDTSHFIKWYTKHELECQKN